MYKQLCTDLEKASHAIATAFIQKMYDYDNDEQMDEIYFIGQDPTGTLCYGEEFWSLDTMYETLLHNYDKEDVWNYYLYSLEHSGENRETYINLWHFVRKYKGYKGDLADIAKHEKESREANRKYWNSKESKAETEKYMKEATDEFLKSIGK